MQVVIGPLACLPVPFLLDRRWDSDDCVCLRWCSTALIAVHLLEGKFLYVPTFRGFSYRVLPSRRGQNRKTDEQLYYSVL